MTIKEAIASLVGFRVKNESLQVICSKRNLNPDAEYNSAVPTQDFELAVADTIQMYITMPSIAEGGVSISFDGKEQMIALANRYYLKYGESPITTSPPATVRPLNDW